MEPQHADYLLLAAPRPPSLGRAVDMQRAPRYAACRATACRSTSQSATMLLICVIDACPYADSLLIGPPALFCRQTVHPKQNRARAAGAVHLLWPDSRAVQRIHAPPGSRQAAADHGGGAAPRNAFDMLMRMTGRWQRVCVSSAYGAHHSTEWQADISLCSANHSCSWSSTEIRLRIE